MAMWNDFSATLDHWDYLEWRGWIPGTVGRNIRMVTTHKGRGAWTIFIT